MRPLATATALLAVAAALAPALAQELERVPPVTNEAAKKECGACHMAYQPQFLPANSWRRILADLGNHFGEDASLDDAVRQETLGLLRGQRRPRTERRDAAADHGAALVAAQAPRGGARSRLGQGEVQGQLHRLPRSCRARSLRGLAI